MPEPLSPPELLDLHLADLRRRNLSPHTVLHRKQSVAKLMADLPLDASRIEVEEWLDRRDYSPATRLVWISHLSMFYKWAIQEGYLTVDPTAGLVRPKPKRGLPRPISDVDLLKALEDAMPMMKVWLLLAAYQGLRCGEISWLKREDIDLENKLLRVTHAKGGSERLIPLHPEVLAALRRMRAPQSGRLFFTAEGDPVTPNYVSLKISQEFHRLGIAGSAHSLRHWFATRLLSSTHDLRVVSETLGHRSMNTTRIYADWDREVANAGVWSLRVMPPKPTPSWRKKQKQRFAKGVTY